MYLLYYQLLSEGSIYHIITTHVDINIIIMYYDLEGDSSLVGTLSSRTLFHNSCMLVAVIVPWQD